MSTDGKMSVLCLAAHPDDAELMAGGTIARWVAGGHRVHVLCFSDGSWTSPGGEEMRETAVAGEEARSAAGLLGYSYENLGLKSMELEFDDSLVRETLRRVEKLGIDTIVSPWEKDVHHDHEVVCRVAMSASRRVPRFLMGQINYYLRDFFAPNIFVDISETWGKKIQALESFRSQWDRAGADWYGFLDGTSRYYGKMAGVERAEGFVSRKFLFGA